MSSNVVAAAGTPSRRADSQASGRVATLVALLGVLLAVSAAVLFVPVAPTTAAGTQLVTAAAAEQFVEDTHVRACPGQVPAVTCAAAGAGWSCRWTGGATQVARTPGASFVLAC
ncbi:hypothetical protein [Patulibacter americanus]|uniref:hypothetical protein n=1 Tax=Patulibacter americanus TaxID=588672 RepID=UPI0003B638D3|nr:hypothetical protein [Patulibacter americanus]